MKERNEFAILIGVALLAVALATGAALILRRCKPLPPDPLPPTSTFTPLPPTVTLQPPTASLTPTLQPPTRSPTGTAMATFTPPPTDSPTERPTASATPWRRVTAHVLPTDTPVGPGDLPETGGAAFPWLVVLGGALVLIGVAARVFGRD